MDPAAAAQLKALLVGVALPAKRADLLEYAVQQHAEPSLLGALQTLSDEREYASLNEVVEELLQVQPAWLDPVPQAPQEESGKPPGGEAYTEPHPEPGAVRESSRTAGT
jgi:hypothetical protein